MVAGLEEPSELQGMVTEEGVNLETGVNMEDEEATSPLMGGEEHVDMVGPTPKW
jgi:hypothetical protein